ncbi:MAG: hypothetical protein JST54_19485 [Deltaproteobacteria bacterium]|nr:hypothetical protein [Deltaproteobacteria bacterium]
MPIAVLVGVGVAFGLGPVIDNDLGFHLRTGAWILAHHAFPRTDPFSQDGAQRVYLAYGWLFDLLVSGLHTALGLRGLVLYRAVLAGALGAALGRLARARNGSSAPAAALLALVALRPCVTERPWLFTLLFTALTLDALLRLREGQLRHAWGLVPLFALWANLHVQFVYGLALLGLAAAAALWGERRENFRHLALLTAACTFATLLNPYGWRLWATVFHLARQTSVFGQVAELSPPTFQDPEDWVILGMTLLALVLLVIRKPRSKFELLAMALALALGARAERDTWLPAMVALPVLADVRLPLPTLPVAARTALQVLATAVATLGFSVLVAAVLAQREPQLEKALAQSFPLAATDRIRSAGWPGPLYNDFNWGGFLIWKLPEHPVSMDGRTNVYTDPEIARHLRTWRGQASPADWDPRLQAARVVLAPLDAPLTAQLRKSDAFQLAYEDAISAVFVRR